MSQPPRRRLPDDLKTDDLVRIDDQELATRIHAFLLAEEARGELAKRAFDAITRAHIDFDYVFGFDTVTGAPAPVRDKDILAPSWTLKALARMVRRAHGGTFAVLKEARRWPEKTRSCEDISKR